MLNTAHDLDTDAPPAEDLYQDLFTDEGEGAGLLYLQNTEVDMPDRCAVPCGIQLSLPHSTICIVQLKQRIADQERIIAGLNAKVSHLIEEVRGVEVLGLHAIFKDSATAVL